MNELMKVHISGGDVQRILLKPADDILSPLQICGPLQATLRLLFGASHHTGCIILQSTRCKGIDKL